MNLNFREGCSRCNNGSSLTRKRSWEGRWTGGAAGEEWVTTRARGDRSLLLGGGGGQRTCGTTASLGQALAWGRSGRVGGSHATVDGWSAGFKAGHAGVHR